MRTVLMLALMRNPEERRRRDANTVAWFKARCRPGNPPLFSEEDMLP